MKNKRKKGGDTHPRQPIRLDTVFDVNRLLAKVINDLIRDKISENKAGKVGYLCNIMLGSFQTVEFERRISELEARLENRANVPFPTKQGGDVSES